MIQIVTAGLVRNADPMVRSRSDGGHSPTRKVEPGPRGDPVFDSWRSVGDTLLWWRGDVTYWIESALGRAATIAVAESLR